MRKQTISRFKFNGKINNNKIEIMIYTIYKDEAENLLDDYMKTLHENNYLESAIFRYYGDHEGLELL